jgi:tetratricopeptide (TPR) repeat protein
LKRRVDQHLGAGMDLFRAGRYWDAIEEWRAGFRLDEADYRCLLNAGVAYLAMGHLDEAGACSVATIELRPDSGEAWDNYGVVWLEKGDNARAVACHRRALELRYSPRSERNLAAALERLGETAEARECFGRVAAADRGDVESRVGLGLARLTLGDMRGMEDLDARLDRAKHLAAQVEGVPRWDGRPLAGTLLVNQLVDGFGDAIHGIRSAAAIRERVGRLVVLCDPPIASLLERVAGVDEVFTDRAALPPIAAQAPALQLPWHDGAAEGRIRWDGPYVSAEEDWVSFWREQISHVTGFRVGVAWQGDPKHGNDRRRSFRLAELAPLAAVPGVSLVSLQRGFGRDQIATAGVPVEDMLGHPAYDEGDLQDTAAVMQSLDLVVAPDTGLAHLAGALGVPLYLAIPYVPEWRWQTARLRPNDSPWYPSARLFRQPTEGNWPPVFRAMAAAIARQLFF